MPAPYHPLSSGAAIDPTILRSIRQASQATQVDFGFLMAQASQESGFHSDAKAAGSSATGLFQFIDSTWLQMVQRFGAKYGAGDLAQNVTLDSDGRARVNDPGLRQRILDLRGDPRLSAALAAEYARINQDEVERALGRKAQRTDLYMAHFLGAGGATQFLKAVQHDGNAPAADLLPEAAAANRSVFYDAQTGAPRTVADIYRSFARRIEAAAQSLGAVAGSAAPTTAPSSGSALADAVAGGTANSPTAFLRRLGLGGGPLGEPVLAMLNMLALSALKLIHGGRDAASRAEPALRASSHAAVSVGERRRDTTAV